MRLGTWLELKGVTQSDFARRIGVTSPTVHRIIAGSQNIPLSLQDSIVRETEGAVTPDDLHAVFAEARRSIAGEAA